MIDLKYKKLGYTVTTSFDDKKITEISVDFPTYEGWSSSDIWLDLLNREGTYLGSCCANISRVRDILFTAARNDRMINSEGLHEIYCLLTDHGYDSKDKNNPLNVLCDLWLLIKDDAENSYNGRKVDPNDLEDAIGILANSCRYLEYNWFFSNHPYEDTSADAVIHVAKIIPAIKTVSDKIKNLALPTETFAILKNNEFLETSTGFLFVKSEQTAKEMVEICSPEDNYSYKKVKISLEKGIEIL